MMKNIYTLFLLTLIFSASSWAQGPIQPFLDDVESQVDFTQDNLIGWTSLDLDGLNTSGPFQSFPGKGGPLGFIVYNPTQTSPVNTLDGYIPYSGQKFFASISAHYSNPGPVNDWLISDELADHPGGTFSFYAKSSFDYAGDDKFKVGYSTTGDETGDFILFNSGNSYTPSLQWAKFEYVIPAGAKHLAINCVSEAVMLLIDNIEFKPNIASEAPGAITSFSASSLIGPEMQAIFSWVNPTVDSQGNALTSMTGVKVYRGTHPMNLIEVADLNSAAGESMSYTDILPEGGSYTHRFVPYNISGNGIVYNTPIMFYGYETVPGAPTNISFTQDASLHTVISWDEVDYGATGGTLENPVVGYTLTRKLGNTVETLATMQAGTTFTETDIPALNLFTYTIVAHVSAENMGEPAVVSAYSGLAADQESVTAGIKAADQPFELNRASIISQSIYTPEELGSGGLITSLSYFGNLGSATSAHYKIYMSMTDRETFGTTLANAVWEYFGNQTLMFDGDIVFPAGRNATTIELDQPFYYDDSNNDNVIITIVKPLLASVPSINPRDFYNTTVEGMRTYYANGYSVDLSLISTQPASWSTDEVPTIPSIVVGKATDYGSLSGVVTKLGDGSPLENVTVTITPGDADAYQTVNVTTDETGVYSIPALLAGNYIVTFSKNAFNPFETSITITESQAHTLDATLDNSIPIAISGTVVDAQGAGIAGVTLNLAGFSNTSVLSDANGNFTLDAFSEKAYELEAFHPLYITETESFTSGENDYALDAITMALAPHKPINIVAVNNNGTGDVSWDIPVGYFNETQIGWGSFITAGDAWGNGGNPFMAGIRFETADLANQVPVDAELTHVRAYMANNAQIKINVFEGANAAQLIHTQSATITAEGWYVFELTASQPIDFTKELWIGIEFFAGQYGAYPIGLDDGPNAPGKKGSMKYENGSWVQMSLTNKNWNIYGIVNNTMEANPSGYNVSRSPASANDWTVLTSAPISATSYSDATLSGAEPNMYEYGITALYGDDLVSDIGVSNEVEHNLLFDFTVELNADFGNPEGAYVSVWNADNFAEAFVSASATSVTFPGLMHGDYNVRVELDNYEIVVLSDVTVDLDNTAVTAPLTLLRVQPSNLTATPTDGSDAITLNWTMHSTYTDEIEKYEDFERVNIGNYILNDVDGFPTYTYTNFSWPNAGVAMSYMVFNPFSTTPSVSSDPVFNPVSGRKYLTAAAGPGGVSNDWLIIPAGSGEFSFKASSLVGSTPEKMRVLYSTSGSDVTDFTAFENVISVPQAWTEYTFDAPLGTEYVAINYVGDDTYILRIDDLTFEKEYHHALSYNVYLNGALVASDLTEMTFALENITELFNIAEVEAVYETGVSEKTEIEISWVSVKNHSATQFRMYPNPTSGQFSLELESRATVSIIDIQGRILYTEVKEAGTSSMEYNLTAGTYIIQVQTDKGTATKKLVFL